MKKILADADFLVALAKTDDSNHSKAMKIAAKLSKTQIIISPFTIGEVVTVLSYKVSQDAAKRFLHKIRQQNITKLTLDIKTEIEADRIFLNQTKKGISWFDCYNVAIAKMYNLQDILSFDNFYKKCNLKIVTT